VVVAGPVKREGGYFVGHPAWMLSTVAAGTPFELIVKWILCSKVKSSLVAVSRTMANGSLPWRMSRKLLAGVDSNVPPRPY